MKFIKGFALFIPSMIGLVLLVIVLLKFTGRMTDIQILEAKMDSLIGIIGVAVSVWIGLNIYNLTEKKQVEDLETKVREFSSIIDDITPQVKQFDERMIEEEKRREFILKLQKWTDFNVTSRSMLMDYETYNHKLYHNFPHYVSLFRDLMQHNNNLKNPYPLEYSVFIRVLLKWMMVFSLDMQSLIDKKELSTGELITADKLDVRICFALKEILALVNDQQEHLLLSIKDNEYDIQNYVEFLEALPILDSKLILVNFNHSDLIKEIIRKMNAFIELATK